MEAQTFYTLKYDAVLSFGSCQKRAMCSLLALQPAGMVSLRSANRFKFFKYYKGNTK